MGGGRGGGGGGGKGERRVGEEKDEGEVKEGENEGSLPPSVKEWMAMISECIYEAMNIALS